MSLPKIHRFILTRSNLSFFRKAGKHISTQALNAMYLPRRNASGEQRNSRFAVSVNTALSKRAVVRNRLRRQVHEAIKACLPAGENVDMIIFPKKHAVDADFNTIKKEIELLLKKIQKI